MLTLKDHVNVETAAVSKLPDIWQMALRVTVPLSFDSFVLSSLSAMRWVLTRGLLVKGLDCSLNKFQVKNSEIMELVNRCWCCLSDVTLCIAEHRPKSELLSKCSGLIIVKVVIPELVDEVSELAVNLTSMELRSGDELSEELAIKIMARSFGLKRIKISTRNLSTKFVDAFQSTGEKLTSLWMAEELCNRDHMLVMISACPNLTFLTATAANAHSTNSVPTSSFASSCLFFWNNWLVAVTRHCPGLKHLKVVGATFDMPSVQLLLQRCRQLRSLEMNRVDLANAHVIRTLVACNTPMEELSFYDALEGDVSVYQRLFSRLLKVTLGVSFVRSPMATACVVFMSNLQSIVLSNSREDSGGCGLARVLVAVSQLCPHVSSLTCSGEVLITSPAFENALCSALAHAHRLVTLRISAYVECVPLPEQVLANLLDRPMEHVYLRGYVVSDEQAIRLAAVHSKHLTYLSLLSSAELTDVTLLALTQHCRHLREVHLSQSRHLTQDALLQLTTHCRKLQTLVVNQRSMSVDVAIALARLEDRLYPLRVAFNSR